MLNHSPATIAEAEECIQEGLERLRDIPLSDPIAQALSFVVPKGYRVVVQLEEEGRKKRSTASISNWNHETGEIVMYFEPISKHSNAIKTTSLSSEALPTKLAVQPLEEAQPLPVAIGTSEQELRECCMALAEAEKMGKQFYALKWFRDTYLPERGHPWTKSPQDRGRVLNRAIQDGMIDTQTLPNPRNPTHPTTTLVLNREKAKTFVGSRFRPVVLKGEPLSTTILRDRG